LVAELSLLTEPFLLAPWFLSVLIRSVTVDGSDCCCIAGIDGANVDVEYSSPRTGFTGSISLLFTDRGADEAEFTSPSEEVGLRLSPKVTQSLGVGVAAGVGLLPLASDCDGGMGLCGNLFGLLAPEALPPKGFVAALGKGCAILVFVDQC